MTSRTLIHLLSWSTLFGFGGLGLLLLYLVDEVTPSLFFSSEKALLLQLGIGGLIGLISAIIALFITRSKWVYESAKKYETLIQSFQLSIPEIVLVSFCAGFGEELFFRGFLQGHFGILLTSTFFVAIHGYINPKDWRISIYGVSMVGIICLFGYLYEELGYISAATAHMIFDVVLLLSVQNASRQKENLASEIKTEINE